MGPHYPLRIAFIGAGGVNFGCSEVRHDTTLSGRKPFRCLIIGTGPAIEPSEASAPQAGPWNHSARLEEDEDVLFTAIVDPNTELAQQQLAKKLSGPFKSKWQGCEVFSNHQDLLTSAAKPDAAVVGSPASCRGSFYNPKLAMEVDFARAGIHMLVEKPISIRAAAEVKELASFLAEESAKQSLIIAVGYMLRHHPAVIIVKDILEQLAIQPISIVVRFACAYPAFVRPAWWDISKSGPCIVEQATHFVDVMRFIAGSEISKATVKSVAVSPDLPLSAMPEPPEGEHSVPKQLRNNRATSAVWCFQSGAVGALSHTLVLHGSRNFAEIDVIGDGFHAIISDPYHESRLLVRKPHSSGYEEVKLKPTDMYQRQDATWLEAIRSRDPSRVRCLFADAAKTYEASWWITEATQTHSADSNEILEEDAQKKGNAAKLDLHQHDTH